MLVFFLRTKDLPGYANGNAKFKSFFPIFLPSKNIIKFLVLPLWEKKRKMFNFILFFPMAAGGAIFFFGCKYSTR